MIVIFIAISALNKIVDMDKLNILMDKTNVNTFRGK